MKKHKTIYMKKIICLCMLAVALLAGSANANAQSPGKDKMKGKKTSSVEKPLAKTSNWWKELPTGALIFSLFEDCTLYEKQFTGHGYKLDYNPDETTLCVWNNPGVCRISLSYEPKQRIQITVPDEDNRNWVYNSLQTYLKQNKLTDKYELSLDAYRNEVTLTNIKN